MPEKKAPPTRRVLLTDIPCILRDRFGVRTTYGHLHRAALNGDLPIVREGGRYGAPEDRLAEIAAALTGAVA
jgi:hypothetical protein